MLLLLISTFSTHFSIMVGVHFSSMANRLWVTALNSLPENPLDCTILDSWVFNICISFDKLFRKVFWRPATCPMVYNRLCEKIVLLNLSYLMIILELPQLDFLLQTLVYLVGNLKTSRSHCDTQLFCINTKKNV